MCYYYLGELFYYNDNLNVIEYFIMVIMYVLFFESYKIIFVFLFRKMDLYV